MMERIVMTRSFYGITSMQVCCESDVTDEEILKFCNEVNPSGTTNGWVLVIRDDKECPERNPVPCVTYENRLHIIVCC